MKERIVFQGGGIANLAAAETAVRNGKEAIIAEPRTYLGWELTATGQSYLRNGSSNFELPYPIGMQKKLYLQRALDAGIQVLFLERVIGTAWDASGRPGVLLAGKFGARFLHADALVMEASLQEGGLMEYVFDVAGLETMLERQIEVDSHLNIHSNRVGIHYSMRSRSASISFRMDTATCRDIRARTQAETQMRRKVPEIMLYLKDHHRSFANAAILDTAHEVIFLNSEEKVVIGDHAFSLPIRTSDLDTIFRDGNLTKLIRLEQNKHRDVASLLHSDKQFPCAIDIGKPESVLSLSLYPAYPDYSNANLPQWDCDVAVAGLGSCGTFASLALKDNQVPFIGIEQFFDFGGTRTLGLVVGNYHGYRHGAEQAVSDKVAELSKKLVGNRGNSADRSARMCFYQEELKDQLILGGSIVCNAVVRDGILESVVICNMYGVQRVRARLTLDCTSDADIATLAGVPYETGCPFDGTVQSYGQWGIEGWDIRNNGVVSHLDNRYAKDPDMVRHTEYADLLRGIYLSHTDNSDYNFSPLLTARESRRIVGEYRLSFADILSGKSFTDVISIGATPYDTHGRASSDLLKIGLLRFNEKVIIARVPFRAAIPKGLRGLLVGGKSTSSTRDANSIYRMSADLENMGYALGTVAAVSKGNQDVREVDMARVQQILLEREILPDWALSDAETNPHECIKRLIHSPEHLVEVIAPPKETIYPILTQQMVQNPDNLGLSLALAWFGDASGAKNIRKELTNLLPLDIEDDRLLVSEVGYGMKGITFEGPLGAYHLINMYVVMLGLCGDESLFSIIEALCGRLNGLSAPSEGEFPYHQNRLDTHVLPFIQRIIAICDAVSRLASEKYIPCLESLLDTPRIKGHLRTHSNCEKNSFMCAWIELQVAMCAARCGSRNGWLRLAEYTRDIRPVFAKIALRSLRGWSSEEFDRDSDAWNSWIESQAELPLCPNNEEAYFG